MNPSAFLYELIESSLQILPILIPLGALVFMFVNAHRLLFLFLFFLGFQSLFVDVGVMVNMPRVFLVFLFISLVLFFPGQLFQGMTAYPGKYILLIIILFLSASALLNIPNFPVKKVTTAYGPAGDILFRDRATKQASQIAMFLLKVSIPVAILALCRSRKQIRLMAKVLIAGTTVLCVYGIYQYFAYVFDLPAIFIFRGAMNPSGGIGIFSTPIGNFFRISSLAGEPKDLAGILLPVMIFLGVISWRMHKIKGLMPWLKYSVWIIFLLHLAIFIMTFSTAAWLAGIAAVLGMLLFSLKIKPKIRVAVLFLGVALGVAAVYNTVPSVNILLKERFVNRLDIKYLMTDTNYGVSQLLHMYKTRPETIFYGASLGGALFYEQYNEQPESIIYYLFGYGTLGIILLLVFFVEVTKKINRLSRQNGLDDDDFLNGFKYAMVGSMTATVVFPKIDAMLGLWVIIGLTAAAAMYAHVDTRENNSLEIKNGESIT